MRTIPRWVFVGLVCAGVVSGCTCQKQEEAGTGGGGPPPPPLAESSTQGPTGEVKLEIIEVVTKPTGDKPTRTSFVTSEETTVRARVTGSAKDLKGLTDSIRWTATPKGTQTGPALPATGTGADFTFKGTSALPKTGSKAPNPPLEYEVVAALDVDGQVLETKLPPTSFIRQDEADILRQEYVDYGTKFQPALANVGVAGRTTFNRGNYTLIVEETPGELEKLLTQVEAEVNRTLNDDVQTVPVGTRGLRPSQVVVSPGQPVLFVGPLGDTEPQGDDLCSGARVNNGCSGSILAGRNGIAETVANNRQTRVQLDRIVTSAYRNPQRNKFVGSAALNSRHTLGKALDLDPRLLVPLVPGKSGPHLMCVVEAAGARVLGDDNSFTENGPVTFLECDDPAADHVHVQR